MGFFDEIKQGWNEGWNEIKEESKAENNKILFKGECPVCIKETAFRSQDFDMQGLGTFAELGIKMVTKPWQMTDMFYRKHGELGKCIECGENVIRCPYCDTPNYDDVDTPPCRTCRKRFAYP